MRSRTIAELCCWLVAGWALLSQIGCLRPEEVIAGAETLHLKDATFTPDFAIQKGNSQVSNQASLPATVRYWTAPGQPFTVTWPEIRVQASCNLCSLAMCTGDRVTLPNPPDVVVFHRLPAESAIVEDPPRFHYLSGCPGAIEGPAVFTPMVTAEYRAHIVFSSLAPIPSEPGTGFPIHVLSSSFAMPPRRLTLVAGSGGRLWQWQARWDSAGKTVKEAFDPRLHVGRVRILVGTCGDSPSEPRGDECGTDLLIDPQLTMERAIAPKKLRAGIELVNKRECEGRDTPNGDGGIDLGDPNSCGSRAGIVFITPNYLSEENQAGTPLTWTVEFSEADGLFPPPDETREVWIEFTLVPSR